MRLSAKKGFTLIELLIVVVIIGILAAIAIPKFSNTKDKAKLASVKTDIRNYMTAEEAYFSDASTYGTYAQLQATPYNFSLSAGNDGADLGTIDAKGYGITVTNASISSTLNTCHVSAGQTGTASADDAVIKCP